MTSGGGMHYARAHVQPGKAPLREIKSKIKLKHSYIYDFDPKAVQSSSAGL